MDRRTFLLVSAALPACKAWVRPVASPEAPDDHELATLEAMAETFVPGGDGRPGPRDVGAVGALVDPAYGINPYISEVVSDLDEWCLARYHRFFVALTPDERERALEERMGLRGRVLRSLYLPAYEGVLAVTKLAFYGGLASRAGTSYAGFPGPSPGYAPGSAAGAYGAPGLPLAIVAGARAAIPVTGDGATSAVRLTAIARSPDDLRATLRVRAPDGRAHELALGDAVLDDVALPLVGAPAAGAWALEIAAVGGGTGELAVASLRLRTDLDDRA